MGIDVAVSPLTALWCRWPLRTVQLHAAVDHMVPLGEPFDFRLWHGTVNALEYPEDDGEFYDPDEYLPRARRLLSKLRRLATQGRWSWTAPRRVTVAELENALAGFQRGLARRLQTRVAWEEDVEAIYATPVDDELPRRKYIDRLDPRGMLVMGALAKHRMLAPDAAADALWSRLAGDEPWKDPQLPRGLLRDHPLPNLHALDVNNLLLPQQFDGILIGVPYRIGSARALNHELQQFMQWTGLEREADEVVRGDGQALANLQERVAWNLGILLEALEQSELMRLPVIVDG